jgi:hypothetical protein
MGERASAFVDWRDRRHWADGIGPAESCDHRTWLLDKDGRPQHRACAEAEIAAGDTTPLGRRGWRSRVSGAGHTAAACERNGECESGRQLPGCEDVRITIRR